jgi:hypothetical protein
VADLTLANFMSGMLPDDTTLSDARAWVMQTPAIAAALSLSTRPGAAGRLRFMRRPEDIEFDDATTLVEFRRFAAEGRAALVLDDLGGGVPALEFA